MNAVGVGSPHDFDLLEWLERRLAFGSFAFSGRSRGFGSMTIRLQSRHVKREFPEGAVQVVAKKLRRSLCNTKGAPEMTELEKLKMDRDRFAAINTAAKQIDANRRRTIARQGEDITRLTACEREAKELDGKARDTIARQDDDIRRLVRLVAALESERAPLPTDSADFIAGYNSGFNRCNRIKKRMERDFDKTCADFNYARSLIATFVNNDPNDDAADGVTVYAVWKKDAERFLRGQHVA